ncbi:hypothetical protein BJX70DRAFT_389629 [Aspergillus crustosus]
MAECTENFLSNFPELLNTSKGRHVGIIGAGFAGLRCAEVLIAGGAKVTILEARDRLGGRVHQADFNGQTVDMGPNWIHGTSTNPILKLAKKTNTTLSLLEGSSPCIFDSCGQLLDQDKATELVDLLWEMISDAFKYSNQNCQQIPLTESLKDFILGQAVDRGLSGEYQGLLLQIAEMWGGFVGDLLVKQSLKHFWLEECLDGENLFVANTHARILNALAESAQKHAAIITETRVISIENVNTNNKEYIVVKAANNRTFEFDSVVVTVPLGLLKRATAPTFSPPLTPQIRRAIDRAHYSSLEKVLVTFPCAFWQEEKDTSDAKEDAASTSTFSSFAHFLHPEYAHDQNPENWYVELVALSSSSMKQHAQATLLFSIYGPCAEYVTSRLTPLNPNSQEYFAFLIEFFRPYYSLLPGYTPDTIHCQPTAVLATSWQTDELAGFGSYMNFQAKKSEKDTPAINSLEDDLRALRHGMPERDIWIAGEHAAPFVALGTLTGAYWSGEMVAVKILRKEIEKEKERGDVATPAQCENSVGEKQEVDLLESTGRDRDLGGRLGVAMGHLEVGKPLVTAFVG